MMMMNFDPVPTFIVSDPRYLFMHLISIQVYIQFVRFIKNEYFVLGLKPRSLISGYLYLRREHTK